MIILYNIVLYDTISLKQKQKQYLRFLRIFVKYKHLTITCLE